MTTKTIILEIDVVDGEEAAVKELLAYLAYTKRIRKYLWREKEIAPPKQIQQTLPKTTEKQTSDKTAQKSAELSPFVKALLEQLAQWKKEDKLVRLKALKGKGKFLDIACKIVSHDGDAGIVTVYDVDRKVVETIRVTEIEDINLAL